MIGAILIILLSAAAGVGTGLGLLKLYGKYHRRHTVKEIKIKAANQIYVGVESKMKIATVVGTRPEVIRLSKVVGKLDAICGNNHQLVHTGQNYDDNLNKIFFTELGVRDPDFQLESKADTTMSQISNMFLLLEQTLKTTKPDRVLVLGDTNSVFAAAYSAKRLGIPVYHMEAGNRCFDQHMPEEINRRAIDSMADVHLPYTAIARRNLLAMGIPDNKIFVTGNPINEVIQGIKFEGAYKRWNLLTGKHHAFVLVTAHREENVDNKERLTALLDACRKVASQLDVKVVFSRHPRTKARMTAWGLTDDGIDFREPMGIHEFIKMEQLSQCILTDSGTVQEEACIQGIPCVTLRDNTERPETVECGANILSGVHADDVLRSVRLAINNKGTWKPPAEYMATNVSDIVANIVMGY